MDSGTPRSTLRLFMDSIGWNSATWILLCRDLSRRWILGDKSASRASSFSRFARSNVSESLTVLLRRRGRYVRYGKRLHVASIRRLFLHGGFLLPALISRSVYLSIPADNTKDLALRRFARLTGSTFLSCSQL